MQSNAIGNGPAHGSPVCTVVAPLRGVTGAVCPTDPALVGCTVPAARTGAVVTVARADDAARTTDTPALFPSAPVAPTPWARSMTTPPAEAVPFDVVVAGAAIETVVRSGVPVKNE
jgi:hypothetical protein